MYIDFRFFAKISYLLFQISMDSTQKRKIENADGEGPPNKMTRIPIHMANEYWMEIGAWLDQIELKYHLQPINRFVVGVIMKKAKNQK